MINSEVYFFWEYYSKSAHSLAAPTVSLFSTLIQINDRTLMLQIALVLSPTMGLSQECAEHVKHICAHPEILCLG